MFQPTNQACEGIKGDGNPTHHVSCKLLLVLTITTWVSVMTVIYNDTIASALVKISLLLLTSRLMAYIGEEFVMNFKFVKGGEEEENRRESRRE